MSLYAYIARRFDAPTLDAVTAFFAAARLPEPEEGEYFASYDSGQVVFLNDEACTLRLLSPGARTPAHPAVLQPLGSRMLGKLRLDIVPGLRCMPPEDTFEALAEGIEQDGYIFGDGDREARNAGLLPDGSALILDPGALRKLSRGVAIAGDALLARQQVFAPLRTAFDRCWPDGASLPAPEKLAAFFQDCRDARADGTLTAGWTQLSGREFQKSREIKKAASGYQAHRRYHEREPGELGASAPAVPQP